MVTTVEVEGNAKHLRNMKKRGWYEESRFEQDGVIFVTMRKMQCGKPTLKSISTRK